MARLCGSDSRDKQVLLGDCLEQGKQFLHRCAPPFDFASLDWRSGQAGQAG